MEKAVTKSVKNIITTCEDVKTMNGEIAVDYYSADWLTGGWLEEQLAGQRHLAGLINTLSNFRLQHEHLADWMFSNQLLQV